MNSAQFDLLTWIMDEAKGKDATDWHLALLVMSINFSAIHTTSIVRHVLNYAQTSF